MIKNPIYLFGLGTGFILSSLVFAMTHLIPGVESSGSADSLLDQGKPLDIRKEEAKKQGLILMENGEYKQQLEKAKQQGKNEENPSTNVYILPGMTVSDTARLLVSSGVLEDGNEFIRLAEADGVSPIRSGVFKLPVGGKAADVLRTLSSPAGGKNQ